MNQIIETIHKTNEDLEYLKTLIGWQIQQNNEYAKNIKRYQSKEFRIEEIEGENLEDRKNRIEKMIDQLEEIKRRSILEMQINDNFRGKMKELKKEMKQLKMCHFNEKEECQKKIIEMENERVETVEMMRQIESENHKKEIDKLAIVSVETIKLLKDISLKALEKPIEDNIGIKIVEQIKNWTNKKCREVLFDSSRDNWNENTSIFHEKIKGKSNLVFLICDENKNIFGYYFNGTVNTTKSYLKANGSFLFRIASNGKIDKPMKFEEKSSSKGLFINDKSEKQLFSVYDGFWINKQNEKNTSRVMKNERSFDYHGETNVFYDISTNGSEKQFPLSSVLVCSMI